MIKSFTLFTDEIDDIQIAVESIKSQLAQKGGLLKNTIGIISCYADFVASGAYRAICDALPFETLGATTVLSAVAESRSEILLTVMVMTSDDVFFSTGLSAPCVSEDISILSDAYNTAKSTLPGSPLLILSFAPLLVSVGSDFFVKTWDEVSGGVPNFGTLCVDHNEDYHESSVLYNGQAYQDRYAFALLSGNVSPKYYVASISNKKLFDDKAVVTASHGNQLQTVDNAPVSKFLERLGLTKNAEGAFEAINSFPILVDLNDGTMPTVRAMFAITPEGYAVCGGDIPVGATLSVGTIDALEVISTTKHKIEEAIKDASHDCLICFSCIGRYFFLGYDTLGEVDKIKALMDNTNTPYHFAYSGCEICPVYGSDTAKGSITNRSHNLTLIICAL